MTTFVRDFSKSEFIYSASAVSNVKNAYQFINKTLNINLKGNTDSYFGPEYRIVMDFDVVFVYFNELNKPFIREITEQLNEVLCSRRHDLNWAFNDDKNYCEFDPYNDNEDDDDTDNESMRGADITEEEAEEWFKELEEEQQKIEVKNNTLNLNK